MKAHTLVLFAGLAMIAATVIQAADAPAEKSKLDGVMCVVAKRAAKADKTVEKGDATLYFCCPNCIKKYKADPAAFEAKANHQIIETGQAKQVACPISGRALNKDHSLKVGEVEVVFCCPNCKGKVAAAEGDEKANLVFGDKAFKKGYKVAEDNE